MKNQTTEAVDIFIEWKGPYTLKGINDLKNEDKDYGVYQIYGTHPVYGSHVLLYIGKAAEQTFGQRINQEGWYFNSDKEQVQIYIGRLFGKNQPKEDEWNHLIALAEQLLIFSHWPAGNSSNINSISRKQEMLDKFKNVRIYNYDHYRNLMPEVSGKMYIEEVDFDESMIFGSK